NWSPSDYYQVVLPTTGVSDLQVSWDQARSSTGPAAFALEMSTDGTTFTRLMNYTVAQSGGGGAPGTWSTTNYNSLYTNTYDLPETADNVASLYLRFTNIQTAVSSASGSNRIDNIAINVVPEPSTVALVGLAVGGMLLRRRKET
ncbi:MAG: PEP-CTERM sorting domain-containing protein, partial [Alphaproteobacteria bacterium]